MRGLFFLAMSVAFAQQEPPKEDTWWKVVNIDPGVELRIYKTGSVKPISAKMDEANSERIVVIAGKAQTAIPKGQIYRVDFRPPSKEPRIKRQSTITQADPARQPQSSAKAGSTRVPHGTTESGSTLTFGNKPDFETIYRREASAPQR